MTCTKNTLCMSLTPNQYFFPPNKENKKKNKKKRLMANRYKPFLTSKALKKVFIFIICIPSEQAISKLQFANYSSEYAR